jgi:serine/threonine protein kinase
MSEQNANNPSDNDPRVPELPDVDLLRQIGQGGFGQVWLATNRTTGQLCAVKVIALDQSSSTDPAGREIASLTRLGANFQLRHANLMTIHHAGKTDEHFFYIMDAADDLSGRRASTAADYRPANLHELLEQGPLSTDDCLQFARGLLAGLACLHEAGMVHRDVKPANCLLVGGQLKLADFGLLTHCDRQISRVGTQGYMPPDGHMNERADVYAAGLVIYEMLSGHPAREFPRLGEQARPVAADPGLAALNRLALKACERDPDKRFTDASEMLAELDRYFSQTTGRRVESRRMKSRRMKSRRPAMVATVVAVAVLAVITMAFWPTEPERVRINFITHPFEATIYIDGKLQTHEDGTSYTTPCTITGLAAQPQPVMFRREGLPDLKIGEVDFRKTRQITGRWDTQ